MFHFHRLLYGSIAAGEDGSSEPSGSSGGCNGG
jgi:hypothetical protein